MAKIKIAAVSYLNTVPFIYGIEYSGNMQADLMLAPPSECARLFTESRAEIALVPVAAIPTICDAQIITSFCIGTEKSVRTVMIMSTVPSLKIKRLWGDSHSLTSVMLTRILCSKYWKIAPEFIKMADYGVMDRAEDGDAFLLIGDKVFGHEGRFRYNYDLADEWRGMTGLPFVFAVWIARKGISPEKIDALESALMFGVEHIYEALVEYSHQEKDYAYHYLTENIDFLFDAQKRKAFEKFLELGRK